MNRMTEPLFRSSTEHATKGNKIEINKDLQKKGQVQQDLMYIIKSNP